MFVTRSIFCSRALSQQALTEMNLISGDPTDFCIVLINGAVGESQKFGLAETNVGVWALTGIGDDPPS